MPSNRRPSLLPGRTGVASSLLGLLAMFSQGHLVQSNSGSGTPCPTELAFCVVDAECTSCIATLLAFESSSAIDVSNFEECTELYDTLCGFADANGCDMTNTVLLEFATCLAEEEYGCVGFEECDPDVLGTTPAPSATTGPTLTPSGATLGATPLPTAGATVPADDMSGAPTPAPTVIGTPLATTSDPLEAGSSTSGAVRSSPATHTNTALGTVLPAVVVIVAAARFAT